MPEMLRALQSAAGNRAVTALAARRTQGMQQRTEARAVARQANPGVGPKAGAGGSSRSGRFNDYADLIMDLQALAAAAINRGGRGLEGYRLGRDLSTRHRHLLEDVRRTLIDGRASSSRARVSAMADWRSVSARLRVSLDEARKLDIPGAALAAAADDIAMIGERYLRIPPRHQAQAESPEDYADTVGGIQKLLDVFDGASEASPGMVRENVQGRPDEAVSPAVHEVNRRQQTELQAVGLGQHISKRHRTLVEKLRAAMLLARGETSGSAYKAVVQWKSITGELHHVMARAPLYLDADVNVIAERLDEFGGLLGRHYELVHAETVTTALKPERQLGEAEAERAATQLSGTEASARLRESHMLNAFRHMLEVIEHGLTRMPGRPGEWLLKSAPGRHGGRLCGVRIPALVVVRIDAVAAWCDSSPSKSVARGPVVPLTAASSA